MTKRIFDPALREMATNNTGVFGPMSFQAYVKQNQLREIRTQPSISVDSLRRVPAELKEEHTMVFHLGSPPGEATTSFALARCVAGWTDFFLIDDELFSQTQPKLFIPTVPVRQLFAFQLLPGLTETSCVNLAIASGLLSHALGLDEGDPPYVPATGQSTPTFPIGPHPAHKVTWQHQRGQVQIDGVFIAKRDGIETLFVLEAKAGKGLDSLAKHKLVYPLLALRSHVPDYMPITPVYLRAVRESGELHFYVATCTVASDRGQQIAISSLEATSAGQYVVRGFGDM